MKVSIRDIAREANVSITTVSRYLNNDFASMRESTRKRIEEAIRQNGYVYKPKGKKRERIAIVMPNIVNPFFARMVSELECRASEMGYEVQLGLSHEVFEKEREHIQRLVGGGIDGIVYMSTVATPDNCYEYLKTNNIPFVALDSYLKEYELPAIVFVDGRQAMYDVTRHLLLNGHRNIAYISGLRYNSFSHDRYQGYSQALLEAGIPVDPGLVRFCGFDTVDGSACFSSLCESGAAFTAVMCENDMLAVGIADECRRRGIRIPDDMSLTGFDNTFMAQYYNPPLSTVDQNLGQQAKRALELLGGLMRGEAMENRVVRIPPTLIERGSVKNIGQ